MAKTKKLSIVDRFKLLFTGNIKALPLGELLPGYLTGTPVWTDWSTENAISQGYKASSYVYACIYRLMKAASSVPWKVRRYNERKNKYEDIVRHPIELLLKKPNKYMSGQDLFERLVAHLYLSGNGIWGKVRVRGIVAELWPYFPDKIKPVPSKTEFISHYEYRDQEIYKRFETSDILHFMFCDPSNMYWGLSPLQAGAKTIDTDVEAVKWNKVALQNRCITDGVFTLNHPITKKQWEEVRQMIAEQHQGADSARAPWVLGYGADWKQMALSPVDMDFIEGRKLTRAEICAIFNVPPPLVAITEGQPYQSMKEARRIFWLDTVIPLLDDIKSALNLGLAGDFGPDIEIYYDVSGVEALAENFGEKVATAKNLWSMGVPFNIINQRLELGLGDIPQGDTSYIPTSLLPSGSVSELLGGKSFKSFNLTNEAKTMYWKAIDRARLGHIGKYAAEVDRLFSEEAKDLEKIYKKDGEGAIEKYFEERKKIWAKALGSLYIGTIEDFGQRIFSDLTKNAGGYETKDFNPFHVFITSWIARVSPYRATLIVDSSKELANKIITSGVEEGLSVAEISKNLRQFYSEKASYRAMVVARTEVLGASSFGSLCGAKQTGIPGLKKEWIATRDDRTRDDHAEVDGQTVAIDGYFTVGGEQAEYPGDFNLSAEQTIQCRCSIGYKK